MSIVPALPLFWPGEAAHVGGPPSGHFEVALVAAIGDAVAIAVLRGPLVRCDRCVFRISERVAPVKVVVAAIEPVRRIQEHASVHALAGPGGSVRQDGRRDRAGPVAVQHDHPGQPRCQGFEPRKQPQVRIGNGHSLGRHAGSAPVVGVNPRHLRAGSQLAARINSRSAAMVIADMGHLAHRGSAIDPATGRHSRPGQRRDLVPLRRDSASGRQRRLHVRNLVLGQRLALRAHAGTLRAACPVRHRAPVDKPLRRNSPAAEIIVDARPVVLVRPRSRAPSAADPDRDSPHPPARCLGIEPVGILAQLGRAVLGPIHQPPVPRGQVLVDRRVVGVMRHGFRIPLDRPPEVADMAVLVAHRLSLRRVRVGQQHGQAAGERLGIQVGLAEPAPDQLGDS